MTAAVAVLGAGSWGTALALLLTRNGHPVRLWSHQRAAVERLRQDNENRRYLPGWRFPPALQPWPELASAVQAPAAVLIATPSHVFGAVLQQLAPCLPASVGVAWGAKGLEHGSGRLLHEVATEILGHSQPTAVFSGPTFAREIAAGLPAALTVASTHPAYARHIADLLHGDSLRAYRSSDMIGVELGGAVKNVLAIAAGIADGLGFGANARAALITRGLAEIVRLGVAVGGQQETFMGLAGVGDLVLTCTDDQSRNRRFGFAIGRGQTAAAAHAAIGQVVEGAATTREVMRLARRHGVDMPITEQVDRVLHDGQDPRRAVENLLARAPKAEAF